MAAAIAYLDTSAFVKLVVREPESSALQASLSRWPVYASAAILRTETVRALRRSGNADQVGPARRLIGAVNLVRLDEALLERAADLEPEVLRTLDALHLAAALSLSPDVGAVFTYDERLRQAAETYGLKALAPA